MDLMNLFNILQAVNNADDLCAELQPVLRIVGIVVWGIKVIVPIILIIIGMIDMAKAVTEKKEDDIKAAQQKLIKRAIAAVLVFLVATIVGILMQIIGSDEYEKCTKCINDPWSCNAELN